MAEAHVHLYCEDDGHEQFVRALVQRLAVDVGVSIAVTTVCGRGGSGRAISELKAWQHHARTGGVGSPDLLIVVIDGNCHGWSQRHREVSASIDSALFPAHVVGCPDPHVERWCMADAKAFASVIGAPPRRDPGKCERDAYKRLLRQSIEDGDQPILTNEMEFAPDLVAAMDLTSFRKPYASLRNFVRDLRSALQLLIESS